MRTSLVSDRRLSQEEDPVSSRALWAGQDAHSGGWGFFSDVLSTKGTTALLLEIYFLNKQEFIKKEPCSFLICLHVGQHPVSANLLPWCYPLLFMYINPGCCSAETSAEPSLQAKQLLLKRARLADDLNDKISHRPGPIELVNKNILSVTCTLQSPLGNYTRLVTSKLLHTPQIMCYWKGEAIRNEEEHPDSCCSEDAVTFAVV